MRGLVSQGVTIQNGLCRGCRAQNPPAPLHCLMHAPSVIRQSTKLQSHSHSHPVIAAGAPSQPSELQSEVCRPGCSAAAAAAAAAAAMPVMGRPFL